MKERTKSYELILWEMSDEMIQAIIARHAALSCEDGNNEHHSSGTFLDVLIQGTLCVSPESILRLDPENVQMSNSRWYRDFAPSFDRIFDILLEKSSAFLTVDEHLMGKFARQIMALKREARQKETELNLVHAMRSAPPNQG